MFLSFMIDQARFPGMACLIEREVPPLAGGIEEGFLANATGFVAHSGAGFTDSLRAVLRDAAVRRILISRNPGLIVDASLGERLVAAQARLDAADGRIVLASGGGLGRDQQRYCTLYSSHEPFLFFNPDMQPIVDTMIELYIVDAAETRAFLATAPEPVDSLFELALILHGYLVAGKPSVFVPELASGINGPLRGRDVVRMMAEAEHLALPLPGEPVQTLSGPLGLPAPPAAPGRAPPSEGPRLERAIADAVAPFLDRLALSIVTRTQFRRLFLLRRLLTTISRSRIEGVDVEVVLSTDIDAAEAADNLALLRAEYPALTLTLSVNPAKGHSRVNNLVSGIAAASGDYVWFVDDDDYVDFLAFRHLAACLFAGARPLILGASLVHHESWDMASPDFPVLATNVADTLYPAEGWRGMFGGVNQLPICGAVMPRAFLLDRLATFDLRFDLSEDYALFLLLLSAPDLPPLVELPATIAHISVRAGGDNSITAPDRTFWARDIAAYLFDLVHAGGRSSRGIWAVLATPRPLPANAPADQQVARLQAEVRRKDAQIGQLAREADRLRAIAGRRLAGDMADEIARRRPHIAPVPKAAAEPPPPDPERQHKGAVRS